MEKLSLKSQQDIKIYSAQVSSSTEKKSVFAVGFSAEDAITVFRGMFKKGVPISINITGFVPLVSILKDLNINLEEPIASVPTQEPQMNKESFVQGLRLVTDRYVESTNDKKSLKRILGKIK